MYLDKIVVTKKQEVAELAAHFSIAEATLRIAELPSTRGFHEALEERRKREMGLIAEVKKASPSKGLIRADFHPVELARSYEQAGADCISVLTDREYFQGSPDYLQAIREVVELPLLRKDFIIDERQIYEARLLGADAILLIAAILDDAQLKDYLALAASIGLDSLVEVHDEKELERVLRLDNANLVGINNRNLKNFETTLEVTKKLAAQVPSHITLISESGITSREDIDNLASYGAKGVLIGETFMRQADIKKAVAEVMGPLRNTAVEDDK